MKRKVYKIGSRFGISAYMDIETKKVLVTAYDSPHEGGILYSSPDGIEEVPEKAIEELKQRDIRVYNRVMNIKSGVEDFVRYAWYDMNAKIFVTISDEEWAWKCEANKSLVEHYEALGYVLRPISLEDEPYEAETMDFPL